MMVQSCSKVGCRAKISKTHNALDSISRSLRSLPHFSFLHFFVLHLQQVHAMQLFGPPQILPQVPVLPSNSAPFPVSVFPHVPYPDEEQQGTRVQAFEDTYRLYVLGIPHLTNVDYGIPSDPVATRQKALQIHQSWLYREPNALEIESLATWLWREWMKLPKYSTYRKNQAKDSRRKRPCKNFSWNDEMEWALFRGSMRSPRL